MRSAFVKALIAATAVACLAPPAAWAQASKPVAVRAVVHDLTVELRQVKDGEQDQPNAPAPAYTVGTANRAARTSVHDRALNASVAASRPPWAAR